jgi:hypothetical protein
MNNTSNLPSVPQTSEGEVRTFFDGYFTDTISFPAADIDAVVGFFEKRGFDTTASNSTAIVLLQQARLDNVNVFELVDTLKGATDVQLSAVVTEILNYNRQSSSALGYRQNTAGELLEKRNVMV